MPRTLSPPPTVKDGWSFPTGNAVVSPRARGCAATRRVEMRMNLSRSCQTPPQRLKTGPPLFPSWLSSWIRVRQTGFEAGRSPPLPPPLRCRASLKPLNEFVAVKRDTLCSSCSG